MLRLPIPRRAGALLAAALALPGAATAQERFFPATEDVEIMLRYLVEDGETPGIVLGFIEADGSTRVIHYGDAGPDTRPLGPKSVFEIGSITKTFTAALLADRVARGEMALDDPVQKYLPAGVAMPKWQDREITLPPPCVRRRRSLYVAGTRHSPALLPVIERVAAWAPVTLIPAHDRPGTGRDDWTTQSDHGVFHQTGIPFLYFGVEDHPDYHRPTDDFESIDPEFFVAAVETVLLALREVDVGM